MLFLKQEAALLIGPGDHIEEMMEDRGGDKQQLADMLRISRKIAGRLLNSEETITPELAHLLSEVFGPGADFWKNADASYRSVKCIYPYTKFY